MKKKQQEVWALMCPDEEQLLRESLDMSDEDVAASLEAKGYDLEQLDTELLALVDRLPARHPVKKRGYVALTALAAVMALCASTTYALVATNAPVDTTAPPITTAAAPLPQDSAGTDAGWESLRGHHP